MSVTTIKKLLRRASFLPRLPMLGAIWLYQKTISPDHGLYRRLFPNGYCKFYPTCSEYGYQAIHKHGLIWGSVKTAWRVLRCNPWNHGGIDLPK